MLSVLHGGLEERKKLGAINNVDAYFDNNYEEEWFNDEFVIEMVKHVDKTIVIGPNLMSSPALGPIPPTRLSGGVKTLICYYMDQDFITDLTRMGDNCMDYFVQIARHKDITASNSGYSFNFFGADNSFWGKDPKVFCLNHHIFINSQEEWIDKMSIYVR